MTETYYTVKDVATRMKLGERTVRSMCEKGELPAIKVGPRLWRILPDYEQQLQAQNDSGHVPGTTPDSAKRF